MKRDEEGVSIVLVSLLLVILLVVTAIVVDIGNARQERRHAQNAVDAAALAGAQVYDGSKATEVAAKTRALKVLEANGYDAPPSATAANTYACDTGACQITLTLTTSGKPCVDVRIANSRVDAAFADVIGVYDIPVGARAKACSTLGGPGGPPTTVPAGFAGGPACSSADDSFQTAGNDGQFVGPIHSNFGAKDSGIGHKATGAKTLAPAGTVPVQDNGLWTGYTNVAVAAWPIGPAAMTPPATNVVASADYAPGGSKATAAGGFYSSLPGDRTFIGPVLAGVYHATGKVVVDSVTITPQTIGGVTRTGAMFIAAGGEVLVGGTGSKIPTFSDTAVNPYRITLWSDWGTVAGGARCAFEPIQFAGECNHFDGVAYGPYGRFRLSGNGNGHWHNNRPTCSGTDQGWSGGAVAWAISLSGERNLLRSGNIGTGSPGGPPAIFIDA